MADSFATYVDVPGIVSGAFSEIDLKRNIDGTTQADGSVRLYDIPKNILVENNGTVDLIVKWSTPAEEDDIDNSEWKGVKVSAGKAVNLIFELYNRDLRIPTTLYIKSVTGTGSAVINLALFYSIFE